MIIIIIIITPPLCWMPQVCHHSDALKSNWELLPELEKQDKPISLVGTVSRCQQHVHRNKIPPVWMSLLYRLWRVALKVILSHFFRFSHDWHVTLTLPVVFIVAGSGERDGGRGEQRREEGAQPPRSALARRAEAAQLTRDVQRRETQTCEGN